MHVPLQKVKTCLVETFRNHAPHTHNSHPKTVCLHISKRKSIGNITNYNNKLVWNFKPNKRSGNALGHQQLLQIAQEVYNENTIL